jgi:hypothetical protein
MQQQRHRLFSVFEADIKEIKFASVMSIYDTVDARDASAPREDVL